METLHAILLTAQINNSTTMFNITTIQKKVQQLMRQLHWYL